MPVITEKPELLSPAGNPEKLRFALLYGADAVYLAGESFGMRSAAGNFNNDELREAVSLAHSLKKRVYLTLNTMPRNDELPEFEKFLGDVDEIKPDAVIIADLGVFALCKKRLRGIDLHISTQGATVNYEACRAWHELGAKRIVLARELSLAEIAEIRAKTPSSLELEVFIHGAMCVSISGRCLLSEFYLGRDGNRGKCAQPCRWIYNFAEVKRPESVLTSEIHPEGTYIFGSKDMCLISRMPELLRAGITSLKIEGRMKSAYYTAVVTNAYRTAIDSYYLSPAEYQNDDDLQNKLARELDSVSHREYCTGYFFDHPMENPQLAENPGYMRETSFLATVEAYDSHTGVAYCVQKNKMRTGEEAELLTPGKTGIPFVIGDMKNAEGESITETPHPQMKFSLMAPFEFKAGDIIRAGRK